MKKMETAILACVAGAAMFAHADLSTAVDSVEWNAEKRQFAKT